MMLRWVFLMRPSDNGRLLKPANVNLILVNERSSTWNGPQPSGANPGAPLDRELSKLFVFNEI
jgi:hypothetical protein